MKWNIAIVVLAALPAACGTRAPQAAKTIPQSKLEQTVVVGLSTKAQVLAALGPSTTQAFDSGYQVWMYEYPAGLAGRGEYVILFGRDGVVKKTRRTR